MEEFITMEDWKKGLLLCVDIGTKRAALEVGTDIGTLHVARSYMRLICGDRTSKVSWHKISDVTKDDIIKACHQLKNEGLVIVRKQFPNRPLPRRDKMRRKRKVVESTRTSLASSNNSSSGSLRNAMKNVILVKLNDMSDKDLAIIFELVANK